MNDIKCPDHPRYIGKGKPTGSCITCDLIWELNRVERRAKEITDSIRIIVELLTHD